MRGPDAYAPGSLGSTGEDSPEPVSPQKEGPFPPVSHAQIATDRRLFRRDTVNVPVTLEKSGEDQNQGWAMDLSPGGTCVSLEEELPAGTPLQLQCSFADICYLDLSGQVVGCQPLAAEGSSRYAVRIKFVACRDWENKILQSAVEEVTKNRSAQPQSLLKILVAKDSLALESSDFYVQVRRPLEVPARGSELRHCTHASKIVGWGAHLPPRQITNKDISTLVSVDGRPSNFGRVVEAVTGTQVRRYVGSHIFPSDLAVEASRVALKNAGLTAKDLDVIISCGVARDVEEPATAYIIQQKLGAYNAYVFDLANACNGFISALDVLDAFIATGRCETGLVAVGDVLSQYVTWNTKSKKDLHLSSMSYTFGDGGGAAILQRAQPGEENGIRARWFLSDGSYWRVAVIPLMNQGQRFFKSNAARIEAAALEHVPGGVNEVMAKLNWTLDDIQVIIPHQVSSHIIENLFHKRLGISADKIYWSFPRHGNVGAASMPVALCEALQEGRAKAGDKILLVGGSGGFGAGVIGLVL